METGKLNITDINNLLYAIVALIAGDNISKKKNQIIYGRDAKN